MKLYNTISNQVEEFQPIHKHHVNMYVCGPTVYNYPHVGNVRPMIVFDTLKRIFEARNYQVKFVSNYTDVDDKIIKAAQAEKVTESQLTEKFINAYNEDRMALNAALPDAVPKVSESITEIIAFIQQLIKANHAYEVKGNVYFRINSIKKYGELSNQKMEDLQVGSRIEENFEKENPLDFTLWKKTADGIRWEAPFSTGRPGWHTECVVMIHKEFAANLIDIHGGGMDLKFPHHENEIAQSVALYHTPIARYWLHNGLINLDGVKMSKSLGNMILAKDLIKKIGGNTVRWMMLSTHYRSPLNVNEEGIETAQKEMQKVMHTVSNAFVSLAIAHILIEDSYDETLYEKFMAAMEDDMNTPNAFAQLFEACKICNQSIRSKSMDHQKLAKQARSIEKMLEVLGIAYQRIQLTREDEELYELWQKTTQAKAYEKADMYRKQLMAKGIL